VLYEYTSSRRGRTRTFIQQRFIRVHKNILHSVLAIVISLGLAAQRSFLRANLGTQNDVGGTATRCRVTSLGQRSAGIASWLYKADVMSSRMRMQVMPNTHAISHVCALKVHVHPFTARLTTARSFSWCPERALDPSAVCSKPIHLICSCLVRLRSQHSLDP
jgi:hypothetical protein